MLFKFRSIFPPFFFTQLCLLTKSSWGNIPPLFHVQTNNDVIKLRFRTSHDTYMWELFVACASNYLRFSMPCFQLATKFSLISVLAGRVGKRLEWISRKILAQIEINKFSPSIVPAATPRMSSHYVSLIGNKTTVPVCYENNLIITLIPVSLGTI